jgi:arylsulfatase A-like enzyme
MKTRSIIFLLISIFVFSACKEKPSNKPNILLINIDDLGWAETSVYGAPFYETPNIDKLASEGMRFTNAYAAASNCAPSRACLMTGQWTPRHGIYTVKSSARGEAARRKLIPTPNADSLPENITTIAEVLKAEGYVTATVGKWHLSADPTSRGFHYNVAGNMKGHPVSYFSPYSNPNLKDGLNGEYLTDRLTSEAIAIVQQNQDRPFFLYLPYFTVHTPIQGKENLVKKYIKKAGEGNQSNARYAAMIESMDYNVGRLLAALDMLELEKNTLVIFTADNGGFQKISDQFPLRAGKGSYYEGGIREPLIIRWPGEVDGNSVCETPVTHLDIFPTLLDVLGIPNLQESMDGESILPLALQENNFNTERPLFWHFPVYLQTISGDTLEYADKYFRTRPGSVVRKGKWKLHEYFEDGRLELYNLEVDLAEKNNLADSLPEKTKALHGLLKQWRQKTNAPVPSEPNPLYGIN